MALIKTTAEAKAALPRVLSNLSNQALLPDFGAAEIKYLVPLIGWTQYDDINGKLNADPVEALSDKETELLPYLRRVSAFFAYFDDLGTDNAKITDNGVRSTETQNMPRVFGWQFKELKNALQQKAFDAVEVLLRFLFEHKVDYPSWTGSEEYASVNSLLIKTGTDFDSHYKLWQPMRTYYSLKNMIDEVQEDFLKTSIGKELLEFFISEDLNDDEKPILKLLKKSTAYKTIKKATEHYAVRFDSNGFTIIGSGDNENGETSGRENASLPLFEQKIKACEQDAGTYLVKAQRAMAAYRVISGNAAFNTAYDDGPMATYIDPAERTRGNENRKNFRF